MENQEQGEWFFKEGDFAFIRLRGIRGNGKTVKVDADAIEEIGKHSKNWSLNDKGYPQARSKILKKKIFLHQLCCVLTWMETD